MADHDFIGGGLKLKTEGKVKKRPRKQKKEQTIVLPSKPGTANSKPVPVKETDASDSDPETKASTTVDRVPKTKAEMEFEKRREKRLLDTILSKAEKSHKQRIIDFNKYLETLTEHFDIQKVSWTK